MSVRHRKWVSRHRKWVLKVLLYFPIFCSKELSLEKAKPPSLLQTKPNLSKAGSSLSRRVWYWGRVPIFGSLVPARSSSLHFHPFTVPTRQEQARPQPKVGLLGLMHSFDPIGMEPGLKSCIFPPPPSAIHSILPSWSSQNSWTRLQDWEHQTIF